MASGAEIIKGTFTAAAVDNVYTINWGKSFSKYLLLIEMTDDSKTALLSSGQTGARMYECIFKYPKPSIGTNVHPHNGFFSYRIVPSTLALSSNVGSATSTVATGQSFTIACGNVTSGSNTLYNNYSYNYTVASLD